MKTHPLFAAIGCVAMLAYASLVGVRPAAAQYMFLDVDGDGVYTYVDAYPSHGPINVDLYIVTNEGAPAACAQDGSGIDINSYMVNLYARDAAVSFTDVTNRMAGMAQIAPPVAYPYAISLAYGGSQTFPPGKYLLLSLTATFETGCPALDIVPSSCYSPPGVVTSFGSSCPGVQGDYSLRLGEDWDVTQGMIGCTDLLGRWPSLSCPGEVMGVEGQPVTFPVTLTDPDCEIFSFDVYGLPPGATFGGLGPFVAGDASGTVSWTPAIGQAGTYAFKFDASSYPNSFHNVTLRDTCTTLVTIRATTSASPTQDDEDVSPPAAGDASLHASVSPNPLGAGSALEFSTSSAGSVGAWLFDIRGRRVATLMDEAAISPGDHRVPLKGFESLRARLGSGVYFMRIATEYNGSATRRVTILR